MTSKSFNLQKHLEEEHKISPFSTYLREIVYGGSDGIVTTFAVVAGFTGAQAQNVGAMPMIIVLLFGFANLFADGVSMALGNFLSSRADQDVYRSEKDKERHEIRTNPRLEKEESIVILINKGFSKEHAEKLVDLYASNEKYWLEFMMTQELEMANPENDNPTLMATATFASFVTFGLIPLIPYILFRFDPNVFPLSVAATALALFVLGILRWKVGKQGLLRSVGETLFIGGVAAVVAYFVGTLFRV